GWPARPLHSLHEPHAISRRPKRREGQGQTPPDRQVLRSRTRIGLGPCISGAGGRAELGTRAEEAREMAGEARPTRLVWQEGQPWEGRESGLFKGMRDPPPPPQPPAPPRGPGLAA